ncbi:MAG: hypothetical protein LUC86_00780 [Prevotellaceae bacterium]|nr:hypothetical protein [Prevotellaceae bacterium]
MHSSSGVLSTGYLYVSGDAFYVDSNNSPEYFTFTEGTDDNAGTYSIYDETAEKYIGGAVDENSTVIALSADPVYWRVLSAADIKAMQLAAEAGETIDVSGLIKNASFGKNATPGTDTSDHNWLMTGYNTTDATTTGDAATNGGNYNYGSGSNPYYNLLERWYPSVNGFDLHQTLTDLAAGHYTLATQAYLDDTFEVSAKMYAGEVTADIPARTNDESFGESAWSAFEAGSYPVSVEFDIENDGDNVQIGISDFSANGSNSWTVIGGYFTLKFTAPENSTASDDEYAEGDTITVGKAQYKVTSENLIQNGGFEEGVDGWTTTNSYNGTLEAGGSDQVKISETGGFNGGAYLSTTAYKGSSDSETPTQAIEVEEGGTYVFLCYTSGATPSADNRQYSALFNLKYESDTYSEDGTITEFNWGADAGETATDWTLTAGAFKAKDGYVGVKMANVSSASFDGFQLYKVEPVETVADTEYSVDDVVEINGTTYTIKGENLVKNGGFEEEDEVNTEEDTKTIPGWTSGSGTTGDTDYYQTSALAKNFTITDACGFNGKQFITEKNDHGINNTDEITQAVEVESSKTYLFIAYTSGKTPTTDEHIGYSGLVSLTYESDAYTEGSYITNLNWGTAASSNNNGNTVCWWTETDKVFTVPAEDDADTYTHVGIRLAWTTGSFDGFQLYEVEQTTFSIEDVQNALDEVTVPEANIGTEAFQYDADAVAALQAAVDEAQAMVEAANEDNGEEGEGEGEEQEGEGEEEGTETGYTSAECYAAIVALQEAAAQAAVLNLPQTSQTFHIIMEDVDDDIYNDNGEDPTVVQNKALTFSVNESTEGGFNMRFTSEPNANLADQVYSFTPVESVTNGYTISFVDAEDATHYLCTNYTLGTSGGNTSQIRTTEDQTLALTVVVSASATVEGYWKLLNTEANLNLGINSGVDHNHALFTNDDDTKSDLGLVCADTIQWTLSEEYGTLVLPFAPTEEETDGLKFYSTEAYDSLTVLKLTDVEELGDGVPYIVGGTEGTYTFVVTKRTFSSTSEASGWLTGVYETSSPAAGNYVLQVQDELLAFYLIANDGDVSNLTPNHCYLTVPAEGDAPAVIFFPGNDNDVETAIKGVEAKSADAETIYDLSGRKVSRPQHGIYIKGGRKIVIK